MRTQSGVIFSFFSAKVGFFNRFGKLLLIEKSKRPFITSPKVININLNY